MVKTLNIESSFIKDLINITKSDSGVCGYLLREAHEQLGEEIGKSLGQTIRFNSKIAIYIMMRAGLLFGLGLASGLEKSKLFVDLYFSTNTDFLEIKGDYEFIIIADAVINTGDTILEMLRIEKKSNIIIVSNVIASTAISKFSKYNVFVTRISEKSYIGTNQVKVENGKGPDTGDRLFKSGFYNS